MSTPDTGPSAVKASARAAARARRRSGPRPDGAGIAKQALHLLSRTPGPARVTAYASYGTEPPTADLLSALATSGFEVLLPRVVDDRLDWVVQGGPQTVSSMGIAEPTGDAVDLLPVRALLIPALAVTPCGDRLGKGGGFYDRVLAELVLADLGDSAPVVAAIVDDADIVERLPTEHHDRRVDVIVTPTRVIDCSAARQV